MENKLKNLIDLVKSLPESRLDVAIEMLTEISGKAKKRKSGRFRNARNAAGSPLFVTVISAGSSSICAKNVEVLLWKQLAAR
jgi:hypothetical protein